METFRNPARGVSEKKIQFQKWNHQLHSIPSSGPSSGIMQPPVWVLWGMVKAAVGPPESP